MGYVAVGLLLVVIVAVGIAVFVWVNGARSARAAAQDTGDPGGTPFSGRDDTPLGDTAEHAGEQDERGRTVSDPDA